MAEPYRIHKNTLHLGQEFDDSTSGAMLESLADSGITAVEANGRMTDSLLHSLSRFKHIKKLNLDGSHALTDRGLQALADMPQLEHFHICWARGVSDAGIEHLRDSDELQSVNLLGTATGDRAVEALSGKTSLSKLKTGKLLTDSGLKSFHRYPVFCASGTSAADFGLFSFEASPVDLLIDGDLTDDGLTELGGLKGLDGLSFFWHVRNISSAGLEQLKSLPQLQYLGFGGELCDDNAMRTIASLPGLRMLQAQGTTASDSGFTSLSQSATLEYLWGRECPNLTGPGFRALSQMRNLKGLAVSLSGVNDESLAHLKAFPKLRVLMPMGLSDDAFRHVGACANLEELSCMYCQETGDRATEHLRGLTMLKSYYAGKTRISDRSLELLANLKSLEKVELWSCAGVTNTGVAKLALLPDLRELSVSGSPEVTEEVSQSFPPNVRVTIS